MPISIASANVLIMDNKSGKTLILLAIENIRGVNRTPAMMRKIERRTQAERRSMRYLPLVSLENLNEKTKEFVDHASAMESVTETEENDMSVMIAYHEAVIGNALYFVRRLFSKINAPSAAHIKLKKPPQNHINLFLRSE
jgi:hypothetical protein